MPLALTKRAGCVLCLTAAVCLSATLSVIWGVVMWVRLGNLQANHFGDPEKEYLDECMRDFEGLSMDDDQYKSEQRRCVDEISAQRQTAWLPHIRLTVDERVCDAADICSGGDPSDCKDKGTPFEVSYEMGTVTRCYDLIREAKAELAPRRQSELFDQVTAECTGDGVWDDYEKHVQLKYCMWKHLQVGVCTNALRTNCPTDDSCCPTAQNYLEPDDPEAPPVRPNQFVCMKSPTVGLYCQQADYRVAAPAVAFNASAALPSGSNASAPSPVRGALCTAASCTQNFGWCRDFADIPGDCLGEACQEFTRAMNFAVACVAFAIAGLLCDAADVLILIRWRAAAVPKSAANFAGSCLKALAYLFCLAGGVKDFARIAIESSCYNAAGNEVADAAQQGIDAFLLCTLVASVGSLLLSPLSMYHGGQLIGLPYARVQENNAV